MLNQIIYRNCTSWSDINVSVNNNVEIEAPIPTYDINELTLKAPLVLNLQLEIHILWLK
jgi:hypothetical protein